ncbi:MAG: hypothetical protein ACOYKE_14640 [Ferruginibacter sp.]
MQSILWRPTNILLHAKIILLRMQSILRRATNILIRMQSILRLAKSIRCGMQGSLSLKNVDLDSANHTITMNWENLPFPLQ